MLLPNGSYAAVEYSPSFIILYSHQEIAYMLFQADLGGLEHKKNEARKRIARFQDSLTNLRIAIAELKTQLADCEAAVDGAVQSATAVCPRMATIRPCRTIQSEICKLEEHLQRESPLDSAEQEQLKDQYLQAMRRYEDVGNSIIESRKALKVRLITGDPPNVKVCTEI